MTRLRSFRKVLCRLVSPTAGFSYHNRLSFADLFFFEHGFLASRRIKHDTQPIRLGNYMHKNVLLSRYFSSHSSEKLSSSPQTKKICDSVQDPLQVVAKVENALDEQRYEDAWKTYKKYNRMEGIPRKLVLNKFITALSENPTESWLEKGYELVTSTFDDKKHDLLEKDTLISITNALAKHDLPIPASFVLRKMVEIEQFPPVSALSGIAAHMSQTAPGAYLAAEVLFEIGQLFKDKRIGPWKKRDNVLLSVKPNALVFNICLSSCLLYGYSKKAERLLELMTAIKVKSDATMLILMAHIYERNGCMCEIKKLRSNINEMSGIGCFLFRQFYNCLLTCYLKFGDFVSAADLVLELLKKSKDAPSPTAATSAHVDVPANGADMVANTVQKSQNSSIVIHHEKFSEDLKFSGLEEEAKECLSNSLTRIHDKVDLIRLEDGILYPNERVYAKIVKGFIETGRINDLAAFLIKSEESPSSEDNSRAVHVIHACISLGLLELAHDLIDEMRHSSVRIGSSVYSSLFKAYCESNQVDELRSLMRDARKCGIRFDQSCNKAFSRARVSDKDFHDAFDLFKVDKKSKHHGIDSLAKQSKDSTPEVSFMTELLDEIREGKEEEHDVLDWNNVIHFFCKKQLMGDAEKAMRKMTSLGYMPNEHTYYLLVNGYAAIGDKFLQVAELWGEMEAFSQKSGVRFGQELLNAVLYCFVRGGYFQRANEVVKLMEAGNMFIDKYKYRKLLLTYHITLYKRRRKSKEQTEIQLKKNVEGRAFKNWVGWRGS